MEVSFSTIVGAVLPVLLTAVLFAMLMSAVLFVLSRNPKDRPPRS
jgi:hypothetical protein